MISDNDIERIATAVARKLAEAELDRLTQDLEMEKRLAAYEDERRALLLKQAGRGRRRSVIKLVTVLVLALAYILMFEVLRPPAPTGAVAVGSPSTASTPAR